MYVIGVDPGPVPGIVRLEIGEGKLLDALALQVSPGSQIEAMLNALHDNRAHGADFAIAYERFVVGRRASRSATASAGARTRDMIGVVDAWGKARCRGVHTRAAADVKPWAVDKRLHAAGLLDLTAGMRHARDAARHALFCAVRDYGLPDPLSSKAVGR